MQLRAGRALIDIVPCEPQDGAGRNVDHICLTVSPFDLAGLTAWFTVHGLAVGEVATRYGAGGTGPSIYLADPEGNGIELKAASS